MEVNTMYLVLPHGNADPERGFSINKYLLQVHGSQIKEDTIEAVRLVKDQIIKRNGIMNVPITKDWLKSCQSASQKYNVYLEAKKEEEELRKKGSWKQQPRSKHPMKMRTLKLS